ncbi:MAG: hypothetical protein WCK67_02900 [bacterium]
MSISKLGSMDNLFATTSSNTSVKPQESQKSGSIFNQKPSQEIADISFMRKGPSTGYEHQYVYFNELQQGFGFVPSKELNMIGQAPGHIQGENRDRDDIEMRRIPANKAEEQKVLNYMRQQGAIEDYDGTDYYLTGRNCMTFINEVHKDVGRVLNRH